MHDAHEKRTKRAGRITVLVLALFAGMVWAGAAQAADDRGEVLFDLCKQCHGPDGGGMMLSLAPSIAGLDSWYVESQLKMYKSGGRGMHADDLGGLRMYPMSLWLTSDEDIKAVADYVASLPRVEVESTIEGGDAAAGATSYALCASCHGANGLGNKAMNSPPLVGLSDWYLKTTLEKYKAGVRGTNPKNPNSMLMRGMALSLATDQAVKDVIAHILTLQ